MSSSPLPKMDERQTQAHATAADVFKTLITLSTAVVTVTVTFLRDIAKDASPDERLLLYFAWLGYILSLVFAVGTLLTLAGNLEKRQDISIYADNTKLMSILAVVTFLLGVLLTILFGLAALA